MCDLNVLYRVMNNKNFYRNIFLYKEGRWDLNPCQLIIFYYTNYIKIIKILSAIKISK